jgi:branched-chain amino acid transport system permease protein
MARCGGDYVRGTYRKGPWIALVVCLAVLYVLPYLLSSFTLSLATSAFVIAAGSYGLYFLYTQAGVLSPAHGAVMGIGAYTAALLAIHFGIGFWLGALAAAAAATAASCLLALPSYRIQGNFLLIALFAFSILFVGIGDNSIGLTGGSDGLVFRPNAPGLGFLASDPIRIYYYLAAGLVVVAAVVSWGLHRTSLGRFLRASKENEELAEAIGMNVRRKRMFAYALSGFFPGLAGALFAYSLGVVEPGAFGYQFGINLMLVLVLGGAGILVGPVVGALLYTFVPQYIGLSPNTSSIVFGCVLVVVILLFGKGIAGTAVEGWKILVGRWRGRPVNANAGDAGVGDDAQVFTGSVAHGGDV